MSSPEYLRRHFGITADETVQPRFTNPENLDRRTKGDNGIYVDSSTPIAKTAEMPEQPKTVQLVDAPAPVAATLGWTKRAASGNKTITDADIKVVPTSTKNIPLAVE
jgi:hypothetical protein